MHIMLDLETWGTAPGSAIRSVGATVFGPESGRLGDTFYRNVSDASCEAAGLRKSASTIKFWEEQSEAAKEALLVDPRPLDEVLLAFTAWFHRVGGGYVWGHGASFDPVLLEAAYDALLLEAPWKFWNIRCCRTVLAMANRKPQRQGGTHHNALDDAIAQARAVSAAFKHKQFSAR